MMFVVGRRVARIEEEYGEMGGADAAAAFSSPKVISDDASNER